MPVSNGGRFADTNGYFTIGAPANDPLVITVGAMNTKSSSVRSNDVMTTYSSKGPSYGDHVVKPDIVAPGNKIFSIRVPNSSLKQRSPAMLCRSRLMCFRRIPVWCPNI